MDGIAFSRAWEDDRLDLELLAVKPGEHVLVVASAGDLALAVASAGAERVLAVDVNPAQLHLAALKRAAAQALDPVARHRWFEVGRVSGYERTYRRELRGLLAADAAAYWDRRIGQFERGFNEQVGVGRSFARLGRLARWLVPSMPAQIEAVADTAEQLAFWKSRVRGRLFGPITHWLFAHTPLLASLAPNAHEMRRMRRAVYSRSLQARVEGIVGASLVRRHPWWRPALSGQPVDLGDGAVWLDPDRAAATADAAARVELIRDDLIRALERQPAGSLDAVSVSNVPDWLAPADAGRLRSALVHALRPGGRALARAVLADERSLTGGRLLREHISDSLPARDRTALYGRLDLLRRE